MVFYTGTRFPAKYRGGLFSAQHGSWNRTEPIGARIMFTSLKPDGTADKTEVFADGWLDPPPGATSDGRSTSPICPTARSSFRTTMRGRCTAFLTPVNNRSPANGRSECFARAGARAASVRRYFGGAWLVAACWSALAAMPAEAGDAPAGRQKAASCVPCHGALGLSTLPNTPNLAGQPEMYLVEQLRAYRGGKRANEVMAVVAKPLSDRDIDDLAAWYGSIRIDAKPPN